MTPVASNLEKLEKLRAGQARAQAEREERARAVLGETATQEQIQAWVKKALAEQKNATRLRNMAKKMDKNAAGLMQQAQQGTTPIPPKLDIPQHYPPTPQAARPSVHETAEARETLQEHPIFGGAVRPGTAATVELERMASPRPEHNGPGVTSGYLEDIDFTIFSKSYVQGRHGGGSYRAVLKDQAGRTITAAVFQLSGHAKPLEVEEPAFQRGGRAFQPLEDPFAIPEWLKRQMEEDRARMERLETILVQRPAGEATPEQKLEMFKKEMEAKLEAEERKRRLDREDEDRRRAQQIADEERRSERRLAELKAQLDADRVREEARNTQMMTLITTFAKPQERPSEIAPLMSAMTEMVKAKDGQMQNAFALMKSFAKGDESPRTWKDRALDMLEDGMKAAWDSGMFTTLMKNLQKPTTPPPAQPSIPHGSAFRLPDGRVVPPEACAEFVARYRAKFGQDPSPEACVQQLTIYMNATEAAQAQQAPSQQQIPGPLPVPQPVIPTREKAEEMVLAAGQTAATRARANGATPEQAAQAAQVAQIAEAQRLNAMYEAARGGASAVPSSPTAAPTPAAASYPQPAPAAVAAARAMSAQPQTVAPVVQAPPPPDVVQVPWMSRSFMQDCADAFQGGQDPVDFLERSLKLGRISADAKNAIGDIYDAGEEDEAIASLLSKVKDLLEARGVPVPLELLPVFMGNERGAIWVESLLFACSHDDLDEARKELKA